jgi:hypothetical protein
MVQSRPAAPRFHAVARRGFDASLHLRQRTSILILITQEPRRIGILTATLTLAGLFVIFGVLIGILHVFFYRSTVQTSVSSTNHGSWGGGDGGSSGDSGVSYSGSGDCGGNDGGGDCGGGDGGGGH